MVCSGCGYTAPPEDPQAAKVFEATLEMLTVDSRFAEDRSKLSSVCCVPVALVSIERAEAEL